MKAIKVLFVLVSFQLLTSVATAEEFAVFVNSGNGFNGNAKDYFLLKVDEWPAAGAVEPYDVKAGANLKIAVARNAFIKKYLGLGNAGAYKEYWIQQKSKGKTKKPQAVGSFADIVKYVKREKGGIGFAPKSLAQGVKVIGSFKP